MNSVKRYRRILAAVDGSKSSKNAFRQACKIVREDKSWIAAVSVVPSYVDLFQTPGVREKIQRSLRVEAEKAIDEIKKIAVTEDIAVKTAIEEGVPDEVIVDYAEEGGYNLVVMGRHGRTALERALMGSVTARVISRGMKDVLVVPEGASLGWKNILYCTDGSERSKGALESAIGFASAYGGRLTAVFVVDVSDEFYVQAPDAVDQMISWGKEVLEGVRERAKESDIEVQTRVREGEAHVKIVETAETSKADIIFTGTHGRTGIKKMLMGSVTEKVIGLARCPVLVIRS